ncbi:MAG: class II aldolase/adducin family protein [Candidatus Omnitrophota bacterium]|jgi:L-fuculose-phosphate aldolase
MAQEKTKEQAAAELIETGAELYRCGMAVASSGNLSARIDEERILITASGCRLGRLAEKDLVCVELASGASAVTKVPSSELPMHSMIYKSFPDIRAVLHCHPAFANGYFSVRDSFKPLTFEASFYLGNIPVVPQETPTVTRPQEIIAALRQGNLVVLKNHGIVSVAGDMAKALDLAQTLEESIKTAALARLFAGDLPSSGSREGKNGENSRSGEAYRMFSEEHIEAIVELVNRDDFISAKGKELDLTLQLAVVMDGEGAAYKFNFQQGRIISVEPSAEAPFVISAPAAAWKEVFSGRLDPFVAVTQGKMKLKGQLGQLSRWYVPFSRLFELFKQVAVLS